MVGKQVARRASALPCAKLCSHRSITWKFFTYLFIYSLLLHHFTSHIAEAVGILIGVRSHCWRWYHTHNAHVCTCGRSFVYAKERALAHFRWQWLCCVRWLPIDKYAKPAHVRAATVSIPKWSFTCNIIRFWWWRRRRLNINVSVMYLRRARAR